MTEEEKSNEPNSTQPNFRDIPGRLTPALNQPFPVQLDFQPGAPAQGSSETQRLEDQRQALIEQLNSVHRELERLKQRASEGSAS